MELHEQLADLGQRLGRGIFSSPDDFRAALDDFLDEGAASSDDIAALVDGVRFGSLASLSTAMGGGADPVWAVDSTGDSLARDRGDEDPALSRWAVAALAAANGVVPGALATRLRSVATGAPPPPASGGADATQLANRGPAPWPTARPSQQPQQPQPPQSAAHQPPHPPAQQPQPAPTGPAASPGGWPGTPAAFPQQGGSGSAGSGPGGPGGWSQTSGPPVKKGRVGAIVAMVVGVLLIGGGGAYIAVAKPFAKDDNKADQEQTTDTKTSDEPVIATDPESLNERYSKLSADVTAGSEDCKAGEPTEGVKETIHCSMGSATTLRLTTYTDFTSFEAAREDKTQPFWGNLYSQQETGVFFSEARDSGNTRVYWDSDAGFQSAELVSASEDRSVLEGAFEDTDPTVEIPTEIESEKLRGLVEEWIPDVDKNCERIVTLENDMLEQAECTLSGTGTFRVGEMSSRAKMRAYRNRYQDLAREHDGTVGPWNFTGGASEGTLIEYVDPGVSGNPDRAFLMWDREVHRVFIQGWGEDADAKKFKTWWQTA